MRRILLLLTAATVILLAPGCSSNQPVQDATIQTVKLPDGTAVKCEVLYRPEDMARGMMFRDSLPVGRGMLFLHSQPSNTKYWMYQVKVPLDIIFMSREHRIVDMSLNTPPCPSKSARECPNYGGLNLYQVVLEIAGGEAAKHHLKVGDVLEF
jgi:uncharacterized membrane protein (UPF0127 family)